MKTFLIAENQLNALVQYLASKPFNEVYQLIGMVEQLKEYKVVVDEPKE